MTFLAGFAIGDRGVLVSDTRTVTTTLTGETIRDDFSKLRPLRNGWLATGGFWDFNVALSDVIAQFAANETHAIRQAIRDFSQQAIPEYLECLETPPEITITAQEIASQTAIAVLDTSERPFRVRRFGTNGELAEGSSLGAYPPGLPMAMGNELVAACREGVGKTSGTLELLRLMAALVLTVYNITGPTGDVSNLVEAGVNYCGASCQLPPTPCADVLAATDAQLWALLKGRY
jgi:hypothetical protein